MVHNSRKKTKKVRGGMFSMASRLGQPLVRSVRAAAHAMPRPAPAALAMPRPALAMPRPAPAASPLALAIRSQRRGMATMTGPRRTHTMINHLRPEEERLLTLVSRTHNIQLSLRSLGITTKTQKEIRDHFIQEYNELNLEEIKTPILIQLGTRYIIAANGEKNKITQFWASSGRKQMNNDGTLHRVEIAQKEHPIPQELWTLHLMRNSDLLRSNQGYNYNYGLTRLQGICQDITINMIDMPSVINTGPQARIMGKAIRKNITLDESWRDADLNDKTQLIDYHNTTPINGVNSGIDRMKYDISSRISLLEERLDKELRKCSVAQENDKILIRECINGIINDCRRLTGDTHSGGALPLNIIESILYRLLSTVNLPITEDLVTSDELQYNLISLSTKTLIYTNEINKIIDLKSESVNQLQGGSKKTKKIRSHSKKHLGKRRTRKH